MTTGDLLDSKTSVTDIDAWIHLENIIGDGVMGILDESQGFNVSLLSKTFSTGTQNISFAPTIIQKSYTNQYQAETFTINTPVTNFTTNILGNTFNISAVSSTFTVNQIEGECVWLP